MSYQKNREEFIGVVLKEKGGTLDAAQRLMRCATTIQRVRELECSVEMSEAEAARVAKRSESAEKRAAKIAATFGAKILTQGDPRGYCLKLKLKSGRHNTWGGPEAGFGVPSQGYPASRFS